jgi:hypothetical protein
LTHYHEIDKGKDTSEGVDSCLATGESRWVVLDVIYVEIGEGAFGVFGEVEGLNE